MEAAFSVADNVMRILGGLPSGVKLAAAAKGASSEAVITAIQAGVHIIGESYLQEAEKHKEAVGAAVVWHFIGHLQRNKVKKAAALFDMIETVDSSALAKELDKECAKIGKIMPVLIEVNSAREPLKSGVMPEAMGALAQDISACRNLRLEGLMTIGPYAADPEAARPYFAAMRKLFENLREFSLPGVEIKYLSMGMTDTYLIGIQEGANIIRVGTGIFGPRNPVGSLR